jgi:hypothetical protein
MNTDLKKQDQKLNAEARRRGENFWMEQKSDAAARSYFCGPTFKELCGNNHFLANVHHLVCTYSLFISIWKFARMTLRRGFAGSLKTE